MHKYLLAAGLAAVSIQAMASCDKLKSDIDGRLQAKGLSGYTLEVVPVAPAAAPATAPAAAAPAAKPAVASASAPAAAMPASAAAPKAASGKVVGNCDGGTKQIIYHRG